MIFATVFQVAAVLLCFYVGGIHAAGKLYTSDANRQYFIDFDEKLNWFESQSACSKMNMTLVELETSSKAHEVNTLIKKVRQENNYKNVTLWIGGILSRHPKSHFIWLSTGKPFTFNNWYANNPNFFGETEFCVQIVMERNLKWNDNTCLNDFGFVCEFSETYQLQEKQKDLRHELQSVKENLQQENQTYRTMQQRLKEESDLKRQQLQQEIEKRKQLEKTLQTEIVHREKLQQNVQKQEDLQQQLQEKLQQLKEKRQRYEQNIQKEIQQQQNLRQELEAQKALNQQFQQHLQAIKDTLQKMPDMYKQFIQKEIQEQQDLQQELKTPQQLQYLFREQLQKLKEK